MKAIITPYNSEDLDGPTEIKYTFHLDIGEGRPFCICVVDYPDEASCIVAIEKCFPDALIVLAPAKTIIVK